MHDRAGHGARCPCPPDTAPARRSATPATPSASSVSSARTASLVATTAVSTAAASRSRPASAPGRGRRTERLRPSVAGGGRSAAHRGGCPGGAPRTTPRLVGRQHAARQCSKVDLPEPEAPISTTRSPASSRRSRSHRLRLAVRHRDAARFDHRCVAHDAPPKAARSVSSRLPESSIQRRSASRCASS